LVKINFEALNLIGVIDEFDTKIVAENVDTEQHIEEDDETARSESDKENKQTSVDIAPGVAVGSGDEGNEANVPSSVVTLCDVLTSVALTEIYITQRTINK
jgi:hypothetical protein